MTIPKMQACAVMRLFCATTGAVRQAAALDAVEGAIFAKLRSKASACILTDAVLTLHVVSKGPGRYPYEHRSVW